METVVCAWLLRIVIRTFNKSREILMIEVASPLLGIVVQLCLRVSIGKYWGKK